MFQSSANNSHQMKYPWNQTTIKEIWILGFQDLHSYRIVIFFILLVIFMASIVGNLLMIVLVTTTPHLLHSPMYFFLSQLSISDIIISSSVCSTLLPATWKQGTQVSITGCLLQLFSFGTASFSECSLLAIMSYDRFLAICKPLHYAAIMNIPFCLWLTACAWILSLLVVFSVIIMVNSLHFCGPHTILHFFCDLGPLTQLSCSDTTLIQMAEFLIGIPETTIETIFIITTYILIFLTILRIPSSSGRHKAFSTCSSHLTVVCTYYGSIIAIYIAPSRGHIVNLNMSLSLLYTVMTPLLNPLIYSLKNLEIRKVLNKYIKVVSKKDGQKVLVLSTNC